MKKVKVENISEAISVFVQVAELAQKSGILSFDDAVITKSAIDFISDVQGTTPETEVPSVIETLE